MDFVRLGRTNLMVTRSGVGSRLLDSDSGIDVSPIVKNAYDSGFNFFDVSVSSVSLTKNIISAIGLDNRKNVVLNVTAEVTNLNSVQDFITETGIGYIDVLTVKTDLDDFASFQSYDRPLIESFLNGLKGQNLVRNFGFYSKNLEITKYVVDCGFFDLIQYPLNMLSTEEELEVISLCVQKDLGIVARMPLACGKVSDALLGYCFLLQYENLVTVWNIKNEDEMHKLIYFEQNPPVCDESLASEVKAFKESLTKK